ncbi:Thymus-specific serine protease [Perkinsus chesapeaki]|uniref:Thymus-specific serine protease n=1 Tax=Perkinsus chesapeaki TaxID=330153 RepID=A0A7J6LZI1_PERCH|nr:Thymus-specific serine protease [Perkinsus chesapeaki]
MRSFWLLSSLFVFNHPSKAGKPLEFDQAVDHFNTRGTFKQRYLYDDEFQNPQAEYPIVLVKVEGEKDGKEMEPIGTYVNQVAYELKATVVALEHRFYGESIPVKSPPLGDLKQLFTIGQAIEDLHTFQEHIISKYKLENARFLLMGCSYPGSLAAWTRLTYPTLFVGAVASCPVLGLQYDYPEYNNAVAAAFSDPRLGGSVECLSFIQRASSILKRSLRTQSGRRYLEEFYNLPNAYLEDEGSKWFWVARMPPNIIVQGNQLYCDSPLCNIRKICHYIAGEDKSTEEEVMTVYRETLYQDSPRASRLTYSAYISALKQRNNLQSYKLYEFQRCSQWFAFQSCNEGSSCPFIQDAAVLNNEQSICQDAFSMSKTDVQNRISELLLKFGGRQLPNATNILVVLGDSDPWKEAGKIDKANKGLSVFEVLRASHCYWMVPDSQRSKDVDDAIEKMVGAIKSWTSSRASSS